MRVAIAAVCAALLCIPASLAVGYNLGKPDANALEDKLAGKVQAFTDYYNTANGKALCEIVSEGYMGWLGPGSCIAVFSEATPAADRIDSEVLRVVRVDGNSAIAVVKIRVKGMEPSVAFFQFELSKAAPAADYRREEERTWELRDGKKAKRPFASWQIAGIA